MMKIGLVHTTVNSIQPINDAFKQYVSDVKVMNFLDEGLMEDINSKGKVTPSMIRQLLQLIDRAEKSGAEGVLLNCSIFSPFVEDIQNVCDIPVLSADIAMLEYAVETARNIVVIATVEAAGPTTTKLLQEIAARERKDVTVQTKVISEAFLALKDGDVKKHNQLIKESIVEADQECDVIILAQMSMVRVLSEVSEIRTPILTSPAISAKAIMDKVMQRRKED